MPESTDLIVPGESSSMLALRIDQQELLDMVRENLGADGLSPADLDRVKVPAGGGRTWEVPTLDGIDSVAVIEGVIVDRATRRAYWPDEYDGSNDPPTCFSNDGITGEGEPGGSCSACPLNQFGTADNGSGKACKETRQMFVLPPDSLIPLIVTIPPASLANAKAYFLRLLRAQVSPLSVVTKIALTQDKNKGGITYSKVTFAAGDRLDPAATERMRQYATLLQPAFEAAAKVDRDEVGVD